MKEVDIQKIGYRLFGEIPNLELKKSANNRVYIMRFSKHSKIFKTSRNHEGNAEILQEQKVLKSLQNSIIKVPIIEYTQNDLAMDMLADKHPFTIMQQLAEYTLEEWYTELTDTNLQIKTNTLHHEAGKWCANFLKVKPEEIDGLTSQGKSVEYNLSRISKLQKALTNLGLYTTDFHNILVQVKELQERPRIEFVHGDFNHRQFITDKNNLIYIVDWGGAHWGYSLADAGNYIAVLKERNGIEQATHFIEGYNSVVELTPQLERELKVWQQYTFLERIRAFKEKNPHHASKLQTLLNNELKI